MLTKTQPSKDSIKYEQGIFSFRETEHIKKEIKTERFIQMGETGVLNYPIFQNLSNGRIFCCENNNLVFVNTSWGQFREIADEICEFEKAVNNICKPPKIAIQRIDVHQAINEDAFNKYALPFLQQFPIRKYTYFDRFKHIAEKFTKSTPWEGEENYAHDAYLKWEKDGSLIKLWQNSHVLKKHLQCKVFDADAPNKAENIVKELSKLRKKLYKIDEAAFQDSNYFWVTSIFGGCCDLGLQFPDLENNPLDNHDLIDFVIKPKQKKTETFDDSNFPF